MRPMQVIGRDGRRLADVWAQRPVAYLSIGIPGFPNLFMLNGPNGPVGNFSLIEVAELQIGYILQLVEEIRAARCREISPSEAATQEFDAERVEAAKRTVWINGLPQLVPRRPRHPSRLAVQLRSVPGGDGGTEACRL